MKKKGFIFCSVLGLFGVLGFGFTLLHSSPNQESLEKREGPKTFFTSLEQGESLQVGEKPKLPSPSFRKSRPLAVVSKNQEATKTKQGRILLRGKLVDVTDKIHRLGGIPVSLFLDGRDYLAITQDQGLFTFNIPAKEKWGSFILSLPHEDYFFPLSGIDLVDGPSFAIPLLKKARTGKLLQCPILPWAAIQLKAEGPQGKDLEQARIFVRPLASPASLGKDRYRLPGRTITQDPPLGPGIGTTKGKGIFRCPKIPPKIPLHVLVIGGNKLRTETTTPALRPGQTLELFLRLLPHPRLKKNILKVLDPKGKAIPGVRVWLYDQKEQTFGRLFSNPSKNFVFLPPKGAGRIRVWAPGYRQNEILFRKGGELESPLQVRLLPGGRTLTAQIRKDGKPLPGVVLQAKELPSRPWSLSWTQQTDSQGMARIRGLSSRAGILLFFTNLRGKFSGIGPTLVPDPPILEHWAGDTVALFSIREGARIEGDIQGFQGDPRDLSLEASYRGNSAKGSWKQFLFTIPLQGERTQKGFHFSHKGLPRGEYRIRIGAKVLTQFSLVPGELRIRQKLIQR